MAQRKHGDGHRNKSHKDSSELVKFDCVQIDGVSLDNHHHICCIGHVDPCPLDPGPLVLMSDKYVLGFRSWFNPFLLLT